MSEISETVAEAIEQAQESRLHQTIALLVAITATFMALSAVKAGNIGQGMAEAQAKTVNAWAYFQSKSTKQNLAEATLSQLTVQRDLGAATLPASSLALLDERIGKYTANVQRYEKEKNEIKTMAEGYEREYARLGVHDDQFDLSDAALSVAIALFGVTALTKKRWLMIFALGFMAIGFFFGAAAFLELGIHPEALTSLLG